MVEVLKEAEKKQRALSHSLKPFPEGAGWTVNSFRYGKILFRKDQSVQGVSLARYGEYMEAELALLRQLLRPGDTVVETSAHYGEQTIPLAQHVGPEGGVIAYEPDPLLSYALASNVHENNLTNVIVKEMDPAVGEGLEELMLRHCQLVKINSGHGNDILAKAREFLLRLRPYLYVCNDKSLARSHEMFDLLFRYGYHLWWHPVAFFNAGNFEQDSENVFGDLTGVNVLGAPREVNLAINFPRITQVSDYWWRLVR